MDAFQRNLENLFCPSLDSAVIAAIVNDGHDRNTCFRILNELATEANLALDRERDSFIPSETWSENSSSKSTSGENVENGEKKVLRHRDKSTKGRYSTEDSSSSPDDAMTHGLGMQMDSLYLGNDFDSGCNMSTTSDEIPLDEEIEQLDLFLASKDPPESPEGFLKTCFPTLSGEKLEILLRENGNDPEKVIDIVLNEVFLEIEQENDSNLSSASTTSSFDTRDEDFNDTLSLGARSKYRKKKRRRQPRQNNVIFQNSGHRPNTNHHSPPPVSQAPNLNFSFNSPPALPVSQAQNLEISPTSSNLSLALPANNRWKSIENELRQLNSMLPYLDYKKIVSTFHIHGNLADTVGELISLCPSEPTGKSLSDQSLSQLISVFPDHDILILKKALVGTNGSVQNATHLLLLCSSNSDNQKSPSLLNGMSFDKNQNGVPSSNNNSNNSNNTQEFFFTVQPPVDDKFCFDNYVEHEGENDPRHCRKMAQRYKEMRNEAFRRAVVAFRKAKGHARSGEGGIASYYSDEGRNYDAQMKRWDLKAARLLVERHSNGDYNLVDLHGLRVNEALTVVKEGLEEWSKRATKNSYAPVKPLKIVTGLGNHSHNGVPKLPPAVARMLEKEKWDFDRGQGFFLVKGAIP